VPIIVIDGPEKAGKSTLATILKEKYGAEVKHFGAEPEAGYLYDLTFARHLLEDTVKPGLVVYDRSWASEVVYGAYYGRNRRLVEYPSLGERLYGQAVALVGHRAMLLGPSAEALAEKRTADDHDISPEAERAAFAEYAETHSWTAFANDYSRGTAQIIARALVQSARYHWRQSKDRLRAIDMELLARIAS